MKTYRKTAIIVGALFLIAMAASLIGGLWLESMLNTPDYLANVSENKTQVVLGVLLELINGIAVIGIDSWVKRFTKIFQNISPDQDINSRSQPPTVSPFRIQV